MTRESLWGPRHRSVMVALMATMAIASYNNLAVTAALPEIGDDLGNIELLPWVVTLELLTSAVAVLAVGPLVDGLGVRRTFRYVGTGFILTSVVVAVAPAMNSLIAARAAQGVFAGAVMTVSIAGIGVAIPKELRPRAFAAITFVWGVTGVAGPAIAATVLTFVGWRGIFLVNIPVTMFALVLGWTRLPGRQAGARRARTDKVGLLLIAVITAGSLGLTTAEPTIMLISISAVVVAALLYRTWAKRIDEPIVHLRHLTARQFRMVHFIPMAALAGGIGADAFLPLYVRGARGGSTTLAAFSVLYLTLGWTIGGWISGRLQDRWSGEIVTLVGAVAVAPGAIVTALTVYLDAPLPLVYGAFALFGVGVGIISSTCSALIQSRTDLTEMGRVNGAHHFLRSVGITVGIASIAGITLAVIDSRLGDVEAIRKLLGDNQATVSDDLVRALSDGYAYALAAGAVVVALTVPAALNLARTRPRPATVLV